MGHQQKYYAYLCAGYRPRPFTFTVSVTPHNYLVIISVLQMKKLRTDRSEAPANKWKGQGSKPRVQIPEPALGFQAISTFIKNNNKTTTPLA